MKEIVKTLERKLGKIMAKVICRNSVDALT